MEAPEPSNSRKYGVPFYAAAWVPSISLKSEKESPESEIDRDQSGDGDGDVSADDKTFPSHPTTAVNYYVAAAGGGGEGRSGISNALILAHFDFESRSLSDQPVAKYGTGSDLPYRMAAHPAGDGIICSFPKSCSLFKLDIKKDDGDQKLGLKLSQKVLSQLEDVGLQLALKFNNEGSLLATGGEDGNLRVFKWPSLDIILNEPNAHSTVKDLDFSPDGKYLVSLGGPCRVWDVTSSTVVTALPKGNDEVFVSCRFSLANNGNMVLYTATVTGKGGAIVTWDATTWRRVASKLITRDNITAFNVSANGKLLACGTTQGDVLIINSTSMRVQKIVKKAHLGFVTAMSFFHDSRALVSASMDSSVRVTVIEEEQKNGMNLWVIIFILLIAVAAYLIKNGKFDKFELPTFSSG
ncbi:SEC12-like protein 2 [Cucurbita pepo subsp. pepo]|uniref:SEC12-like protein 2 n=1 Tax=Cucurbita pepo subsp. pepo TaxID=3664 RepID=UPI000C9D6889|nr:SEC12-like protein 2 [Cucurbita pepo subsp. pepo]